jgi:hypothetical protein
MKKILIIALACLLHYNAFSQVDVYIDTVFVSRVVDTLGFEEDGLIVVVDESYEDGPHVRLNVIFKNTGKDTLVLESILDFTGEEYGHLDSLKPCHNPDGGIFITFDYRGKEYIRYPFVSREKLLLPDSQQRIDLFDSIFLGTDIKQPGGSVYYEEVIECLPTLQVKYMSKNGTIYSSSGIRHVKYIGKRL